MSRERTVVVGPEGGGAPPAHASIRRAAAAVLAVAVVPLAVVSLGHLPLHASDASSVVPGAAAPAMTQKWIAIDTVTSRVTLNSPSSTTALDTQTISSASCVLGQGALADQVVSFAGTGGGPGYQTGSLGVQEKKSGNGASCAQVNFSTRESLTLSLGALAKSRLGSTALASSAYLDVDLKQGASITATAFKGTAPVGTFTLQSGTSITGQPSATVRQCKLGADSGSDANVGDNCRWPISSPSWIGADDGINFDSLKLEATAGSFSLQGGSDGVVTDFPSAAPAAVGRTSVLEVVDGLVGCGGQTKVLSSLLDAPQVTVHRLNNADPAEQCRPVPYSLNNGPRYAQFLKPLDSQTSAQFIWDVTWALPATGNATLPVLKMDYEYPVGDPTPEVSDLGWCPDAAYDTAGDFRGYTGELPAALDQEPDLVGTQYACVISRQAIASGGVPITATDFVNDHDLVYVYGDAGMRY